MLGFSIDPRSTTFMAGIFMTIAVLDVFVYLSVECGAVLAVFAKREKQEIKKLKSSLKLYAPNSAPALAINATIEKTKRRFDNYDKVGLLCGSDGLPHLIRIASL